MNTSSQKAQKTAYTPRGYTRTPLKKALHRAQMAYRLLMTHGLRSAALTRVANTHGAIWCWDDRSLGTNLKVYLRDNGAYNHKELA